MKLPPSFFFWVFLPGRGVVKAVCEPTTRDAATAEVKSAMLVEHDKRPMYATPTEDEQRRLDESASDALDELKAGVSADDAELWSCDRADDAEERHLFARYTHPDDRTPPAWQE